MSHGRRGSGGSGHATSYHPIHAGRGTDTENSATPRLIARPRILDEIIAKLKKCIHSVNDYENQNNLPRRIYSFSPWRGWFPLCESNRTSGIPSEYNSSKVCNGHVLNAIRIPYRQHLRKLSFTIYYISLCSKHSRMGENELPQTKFN